MEMLVHRGEARHNKNNTPLSALFSIAWLLKLFKLPKGVFFSYSISQYARPPARTTNTICGGVDEVISRNNQLDGS